MQFHKLDVPTGHDLNYATSLRTTAKIIVQDKVSMCTYCEV